MRTLVFACLAPLAVPALADCPPVPDRAAEMAALSEEARAAGTEMAGRAVLGRMWEIWTEAPDEPAQALLDRGIRSAAAADQLGALDAFGRLIDYCPHYAEGWNQRAFVHFRGGRMEASRDDLVEALALDPSHAGAWSGMALVLMALGDQAGGQAALREALGINPWIPERALLAGEEL